MCVPSCVSWWKKFSLATATYSVQSIYLKGRMYKGVFSIVVIKVQADH